MVWLNSLVNDAPFFAAFSPIFPRAVFGKPSSRVICGWNSPVFWFRSI